MRRRGFISTAERRVDEREKRNYFFQLSCIVLFFAV
jgi:hypothetical protein